MMCLNPIHAEGLQPIHGSEGSSPSLLYREHISFCWQIWVVHIETLTGSSSGNLFFDGSLA